MTRERSRATAADIVGATATIVALVCLARIIAIPQSDGALLLLLACVAVMAFLSRA